eukprot:4551543-Ditylum_brightwellii.AAC.1
MPWHAASGHRRNPPTLGRKMHFGCERGGGQRGMWCRPTMLRTAGRDRGRHPRDGIAVGGV